MPRIADYIANKLAEKGVTDVFGLPGGVILDLMYALEAQEGIYPRLCYHEQAAGFAAAGYAQAGGPLGVAYATCGPGFTNLLTAMADAWCDSVPVLFLTAHRGDVPKGNQRVTTEQELDTCGMVKNITKYARRIDCVEDFFPNFSEACHLAVSGRKGPVFLDIKSSLFRTEVPKNPQGIEEKETRAGDATAAAEKIYSILRRAKRPVLLAGDGIHQSHTETAFREWAQSIGIPVVSSRYAHELMGNSDHYFGYVGSHGIRYAHFILSKADVIVALGNRLAFPMDSPSFQPLLQRADVVCVDIDEAELARYADKVEGSNANLSELLPMLARMGGRIRVEPGWLDECRALRQRLWQADVNEAVTICQHLLSSVSEETVVVNDVGNNEFWLSRASVLAQSQRRTLYSKSFGALGCALGKAIGAACATKRPVMCFVGDQGLQLNIQEMQTISQYRLPVAVVVLNNHASGMIKDREEALFGKYLHTTQASGYGHPEIRLMAEAYSLPYRHIKDSDGPDGGILLPESDEWPCVLEVDLPESLSLSPKLPYGNPMQDLMPALPRELYNQLDA